MLITDVIKFNGKRDVSQVICDICKFRYGIYGASNMTELIDGIFGGYHGDTK